MGSNQLPELVTIEGDEEVQYVLVDLPESVPNRQLRTGAQLTIKGLDTDKPRIVLEDGSVLQGTYTEQLGTAMLFQHPVRPRFSSATGTFEQPGAAAQAAGGEAASSGNEALLKPVCKLVGMTETRLVCTHVSQAPEPPQSTKTGQGTMF